MYKGSQHWVLFRITMLIWSCGQRDPLDFSLLIIPVIYLCVGGFKSDTVKCSFSYPLLKVSLKNEWHAPLLKRGLTVSSFSNTSLQKPQMFFAIFSSSSGFLAHLDLINLEIQRISEV